MGQISRLKATQIANGNVINANDIDAELNQLVDECNNQDDRLTDLESGDMTFQGTKTFAEAPKLAAMVEKTAGQGISAESVVLKQGSITLGAVININGVDTDTDVISTSISHGLANGQAVRFASDTTLPSPISASTTYYAYGVSATELTLHTTTTDALTGASPINITTEGSGNHQLLADPPTQTNGQMWFNTAQQQIKARINSQTWSLLTTQYLASVLSGPPPRYSSASAIVLPQGMRAMDKTNTFLMEVVSDVTLNLGSAGVNGLDAGTEANSTWYYVYLIGDTTGTHSPAGLFSTVNEASAGNITLPSGYDIKRQLPLAVRNNSSGDLRNFYVSRWSPRAEIFYEVDIDTQTTATSATVFANNIANITTYADLDLSTLVPAISRQVRVKAITSSTTSSNHICWLRQKGQSHNGFAVYANASNAQSSPHFITLQTDSAQTIQYNSNLSTAKLYGWVLGYTVTEVI